MARHPDDDAEDEDDYRYVVHGDALKKILRRGRRRPVPFAFTPGKGEDESLFAVHKKRPPEMIAKATRRESGQVKVAFGTFTVVGKELILTCIQELPTIAKRLKKHLRAERLPLNIRVLDIMGREIEADIEDLGDDDIFGDDDDDEDGTGSTGDRLLDRLAAVRNRVLGARGTDGDRLRALFAGAVGAAGNGSRDKAEKLVTLVEAELRRQTHAGGVAAGSVVRSAGAAPDTAADTVSGAASGAGRAPAGRSTAAVGADLVPLARRARALRTRAAALDPAVTGRLLAALAVAAGALRAGEPEAARSALDRIEAAMDRLEQG